MGLLGTAILALTLWNGSTAPAALPIQAPEPAPASTPRASDTLDLLFTGGTFGNLDGYRNRKSQPRVGSLARRVSYVKERRAHNDHILYFDVGSTFFHRGEHDSPAFRMPELADRAELIARTLDRAGCDALSIGSDDLLLGIDWVRQLARQVEFPILCANLIDLSTSQPCFAPTAEFTRGGVKIGVVGLMQYRPLTPHRDDVGRFRVVPELQSAWKHAPVLATRNDLVIVLCERGSPVDEIAAIPGVDGVITPARNPG